jgi:hypothetical protein
MEQEDSSDQSDDDDAAQAKREQAFLHKDEAALVHGSCLS